MSSPSDASLPPNRHYFYATIVAIPVVLLLVGGLVMLIFGGPWFDGAQFVGAFLIFVAIIFSLGLWVEWRTARVVDGYLDAIRRGDVFAHWKYTPEEYRPFVSSETTRGWERIVQNGVILGIGGVIGMGLLYFQKADEFSKDLQKLLIVGGITLGFFVLLGAVMVWQQRREQRRLLALRDNPPDTYIARDFAVCKGRFIMWATYGASLKHIGFVPGPTPSIEFGVQGGKEILRHWVLLPQDLAADGQQVADRLIALYQQARQSAAS